MIIISAIETNFLKKIILPCFILLFLLLILVPIIGIEVKGAKRWLDFTCWSATSGTFKTFLYFNNSKNINF